jgi:hypothetical protein
MNLCPMMPQRYDVRRCQLELSRLSTLTASAAHRELPTEFAAARTEVEPDAVGGKSLQCVRDWFVLRSASLRRAQIAAARHRTSSHPITVFLIASQGGAKS